MNLTLMTLRKLMLALIVIIAIGLTLFGCESDPILSPQVEVAEEAGGSYGNTNLPVSPTENTENTTEDVKASEIDSNHHKPLNPKRF